MLYIVRLLNMRHRQLGLIAACAMLLLIHGTGTAANTITNADAAGEFTIHVTSPGPSNYSLSKGEPAQGIYLGAYVLQDQSIGYSMAEFNRLTGKKHASFFKYVGYGEPFPAEWVEQVKAEGAFPHIAWEPNNGLNAVKDDEYLRSFADAANAADTLVFLRFASEMNGTWTAYSGNPEQYIDTWRLVHDVFAKRAPKTAMIWTVLNVPEGSIESFYPGDEYVDWVGVNVYNVKYHNGSLDQVADFEDPLRLLDYVYNRFSRTKPIQLSEYGATHYNTTDQLQDNSFAINKITRMYENLPKLYPRVKAIYYFDVNNVTEYNASRRVNDYSITSERQVLAAYRNAIAGDDYLSHLSDKTIRGGDRVKQHFTYRGNVFMKDGSLYADEGFFSRVLQLAVEREDNGDLTLTRVDNGMQLQVTPIEYPLWSGYKDRGTVPILRKLNALPVTLIASKLGYKVKWKESNIYIQA